MFATSIHVLYQTNDFLTIFYIIFSLLINNHCVSNFTHHKSIHQLQQSQVLLFFLISVLNNIPKCRSSKSTCLLTTSIYIRQNGIADTGADWAMISNRPGNNTKRESAHHFLQWNTVFFPG